MAVCRGMKYCGMELSIRLFIPVRHISPEWEELNFKSGGNICHHSSNLGEKGQRSR